ncbi:hypothetical protein J3R30DRAFT_3531329 [Lentinula aciculospora]|uniref:DUF6534 domain-containing protein n=1 Tax=Lentinula aciculospora TaxID=153920 RepID=A0A9W8ZZB7_9AGAR|nr:hypothetical protein J3R30DRAFT_3531329 [Lentinula aciculospora]
MDNNKAIVEITGAMLLGHLFNWCLFGVLCIQVYIYCISFSRDRLAIKVLVYIVFAFDILQTAFTTHYAWYVLASGWGNPSTLVFTTWSLATIPPLTGIISSMGQIFFAWRIWVLSVGNKHFLAVVFVVVLSSAGSLAAAIYCGIASIRNHQLNTASTLDKEVTAWMSLSAACDLIITVALVFQLVAKQNEGFTSVNHVLHRAIRMTIETGAATTILVFVELVLYLNAGTASWYFILGLSIGKVYSNALLANLNSRSKDFNHSSHGLSGVHVWEVRTRETSTNDVLPLEHGHNEDNIELNERRFMSNKHTIFTEDLEQ